VSGIHEVRQYGKVNREVDESFVQPAYDPTIEPRKIVTLSNLSRLLLQQHEFTKRRGDRAPSLMLGQIIDRQHNRRFMGPVVAGAMLCITDRLDVATDRKPIDITSAVKAAEHAFAKLDTDGHTDGPERLIAPDIRAHIGEHSQLTSAEDYVGRRIISLLQHNGYIQAVGTAQDAFLALQNNSIAWATEQEIPLAAAA